MRTFVPTAICLASLAFSAWIPAATVTIYQTSLGHPSGVPVGNPTVGGSAQTYLAALSNAISGTLTSRTTYCPVEAATWGGGQFGGALYMIAVARDIPTNALVGTTRTLDYYDPISNNWARYSGPATYYYPMEEYTHVTNSKANPYYFTKFDYFNPESQIYTFTQFAAITVFFSGLGASNAPPDLTNVIGLQFRQSLSVALITGDWDLDNKSTASGGYPYGTGYHDAGGGVVVTNLGDFVNISEVVAPAIDLSTNNLAFGNIAVGTNATQTFTIYNTGNATLTVSNIDYPSGFSGAWSGAIAPDNSTNVTVTFSPTSATSYGGTVTVNSDAATGNNSLTVSGVGTTSCAYTLSAYSADFSAIGGSGTLTVYANMGCPWSAASSNTWIHTSSSGNGTGVVNYVVDASTTTNSRSGTMSIQDQTFSINQAAATPFQAWKASYFTASELADDAISGDLADPAHDGIVNLLKYALALEPHIASVWGLPRTAVTNGFLTLTYRQNKQATDITFMVEACGGLIPNSWSTNGLAVISQADSNTYWSVTVRDSVPITNAVSRFMRLKITEP